MRAMVQTGFGGPEVVRLQQVGEPSPQAHELVVQVGACGLNRLDVLQRRGPGIIPGFSLPHIAGMDIAGTVVGVGTEAGGVAVGDRVVADPTQGCRACLHCGAGDPAYCTDPRILGGNVPGGLAEFVAVSADSVLRVPQRLSLTDAATLPTAWATAWHALHTVGQVGRGECVVVQAAASAVSLAAVALAKRAGATVVAVASTEAKLDAAVEAGADLGVRNDATLHQAVFDFTDRAGADLVLDHVGADTWKSSLASLGIRGRLVMLGNISGDRVEFSLADIFHRGLVLLGAGGYTPADFVDAVSACFAEGLHRPTAGEYGLAELPEAWTAIESRDTVGKVIVRP